jgi:hypothetical protein
MGVVGAKRSFQSQQNLRLLLIRALFELASQKSAWGGPGVGLGWV